MKLSAGLVVAMALWPAVAFSQTTDTPNNWKVNWDASAEPVFGRALPMAVDDEVIDEAEFGLSSTLSRNFGSAATFKAKPGAAFSPNQFDDDDPTSALYAQIGFEINHQYGSPIDPDVASKTDQSISMQINYKISAGFDDAFANRQYVDNTISAGVSWTNQQIYMCVSSRGAASCSDRRRIGLTISPTVDVVMSGNDDRDRVTPAISLTLSYPTPWLGIIVKFDNKLQGVFYDSLLAPTGEDRRDTRLTNTLSASTKLPKGFTIGLGLRRVENWSNDENADYDRIFIVPSLGWTTAF